MGQCLQYAEREPPEPARFAWSWSLRTFYLEPEPEPEYPRGARSVDDKEDADFNMATHGTVAQFAQGRIQVKLQ